MHDESPLPSPIPKENGCRFTVETVCDDDLVVAVIGDLDPVSAQVLVGIMESAIGESEQNRGVEVDLRRLRGCSNSGVRALTTCAEMGAHLRDGLHFRVGRLGIPSSRDDEYRTSGSATLQG